MLRRYTRSGARYGPRPRYGYGYNSRRSQFNRERYRDAYARAQIDKTVFGSAQFFGNAGRRPTILRAYAFQSRPITFLTDDILAEVEDEQQRALAPLGYAQFALTPYHTNLFTSDVIYMYDRMRVRAITIEYTPTGTESIISTIIAQNRPLNGIVPRVPYANLPFIYAYDPTVNDTTATAVINGFPTYNDHGAITNPAIDVVMRGNRAMNANQKETGSSTKRFVARISDPRTLVMKDNGAIPMLSAGVLDIASLMRPLSDLTENEGRSLATYGSFTVIVPRSPGYNLGDTVVPRIDINVTITYLIEAYGQN